LEKFEEISAPVSKKCQIKLKKVNEARNLVGEVSRLLSGLKRKAYSDSVPPARVALFSGRWQASFIILKLSDKMQPQAVTYSLLSLHDKLLFDCICKHKLIIMCPRTHVGSLLVSHFGNRLDTVD